MCFPKPFRVYGALAYLSISYSYFVRIFENVSGTVFISLTELQNNLFYLILLTNRI